MPVSSTESTPRFKKTTSTFIRSTTQAPSLSAFSVRADSDYAQMANPTTRLLLMNEPDFTNTGFDDRRQCADTKSGPGNPRMAQEKLTKAKDTREGPRRSTRSLRDQAFGATLGMITTGYAVFLLLLIAALFTFADTQSLKDSLSSPEIRYATGPSLISCTVSALISTAIAVPAGYLPRGLNSKDATSSRPYWTYRSCCHRWSWGYAFIFFKAHSAGD